MIATQMRVYAMGLSNGQTVGSGRFPVLPNASRTPRATADTGFHSAKVRRTSGRSSTLTNVSATNVIGKMNMNDALLTTSTLDTLSPTYAMIQETAYANTSNRRNPPIASITFVLIRQPTTRPARVMTKIEAELSAMSLVVRPTRTA